MRGGREGARSILFIVAEVVRTALAHTLLTRLNAKARDARSELAARLPLPQRRGRLDRRYG